MLKLGNLEFHAYGFILGLAALAGLQASLGLAKKREIPEKVVEQGFWFALVSGLIGARLYHVIDLWDEIYRLDPLAILKLWQGGLGIWGGIVGGAIGLLIFYQLKRKQYSILSLLDLAAFGLPLGQAIGRWGNFANRELYGTATNLPWAITDPAGNKVHPLFLYESLLNLGLFLLLVKLAQTKNIKQGTIFSFYLAGYGLIRFLLEALRPVAVIWTVSGFPVAQVVSLVAILVGIRLSLSYIVFKLKES